VRLSVISDEISPDLGEALRVCERLDIQAVELRTIGGRSLVHHDLATARRVRKALAAGGFSCPAIDTPFLKSLLSEAAWPDLARGLELAQLMDAPLVRIFSGLRSTAGTDGVVDALAEALEVASRRDGISLAMEIEHICTIATGAQARKLLDDARLAGLGVVWDPGNEAHLLGRRPDPEPIGALRDAIRHVHVKDADPTGAWVRVGAGVVNWPAQLRQLDAIGYDGYLSMETHYQLPGAAGAAAATTESVAALRALAAGVGIELT
jgi:sugar phosphate isomerase/epimerase